MYISINVDANIKYLHCISLHFLLLEWISLLRLCLMFHALEEVDTDLTMVAHTWGAAAANKKINPIGAKIMFSININTKIKAERTTVTWNKPRGMMGSDTAAHALCGSQRHFQHNRWVSKQMGRHLGPWRPGFITALWKHRTHGHTLQHICFKCNLCAGLYFSVAAPPPIFWRRAWTSKKLSPRRRRIN